jgi:hypothetical protein
LVIVLDSLVKRSKVSGAMAKFYLAAKRKP